MNKPNFFIIGAPKCGTTSLASWMAEHNNIFMSPVKEPHHYSTDLNYGLFKDRNTYISLFDEVKKSQIAVGEASVWYLYSETAVPNILDEIEDAKFIVMLRNPIEMAPSLHEQMVFSGYETIIDFEEAWDAQVKRRCGLTNSRWCPEPRLLLYKEACSLGEQLQRLYTIVPSQNVMTIFLEDIKLNPRKIWIEVLSFVGVPDDGRINFPAINVAKIRRSLVLKRLNDLYLNIRQRFKLRSLGTGILNYLDKKNVREQQRPPLNPMIRNKLIECFGADIRLLGAILHRDLEHWLSK